VAERVNAAIPRAEVVDLLAEQRQWHLILVLPLIALATGVAFWLAGRVGRPLSRLQQQAHAVAQGGPSTPIPEEGPAELRAVTADFNRMAAAVTAREADLTRANAELARSQAVFRGLFVHTSDLVTLFRVPPDGPLVCEDANPATLAAAGLTREQAIGETFYSKLPNDEADWLEGKFREAVTTGRPVAYDRRITLEGSERWFNTVVIPLPGPDGRVAHVASVSRDMTEQRRADQALLDSEALLAALIESATDAIVVADEQDTVLLFNAAAERVFGMPSHEAFGRSVRRLLPDGLCGPPGTRRVTARRHDGLEFPAEVAAKVVEAAGRQVCAAVVRDLSVRRE
jgi:PAS domain S-box-containing protein